MKLKKRKRKKKKFLPFITDKKTGQSTHGTKIICSRKILTKGVYILPSCLDLCALVTNGREKQPSRYTKAVLNTKGITLWRQNPSIRLTQIIQWGSKGTEKWCIKHIPNSLLTGFLFFSVTFWPLSTRYCIITYICRNKGGWIKTFHQ